MGTFTGNLNSNEIFTSLFNMIISQQVFADNLMNHQTLVDKARVDGSLFGDTKIYYGTDVLGSKPWLDDDEALNLLKLNRPKAPLQQAITLNNFRQIELTIDEYLSKRAWGTQYAFSSFNGVMMGWIKETKKVYDGTTYNVYMGTTKTTTGRQNLSLTLASTLTTEERAKKIAQFIADLIDDMKDYSRDFNDWQLLRSYSDSAIKVEWNNKYMNEIRKIDLPTIFHKDGLMDKFTEGMNKRYFGEAISDVTSATYSASTPTTTKPVKVVSTTYTYEPVSGNEVVLHCLKECYLPVYSTSDSKYVLTHFFAGDELPSTGKVGIKGTFTIYVRDYNGNLDTGTSTTIDYKDLFYKANEKIIAKVYVELPPFMSAFEVGTSFFNPKSLTTNHYLTWGHNTIEYLKNYPFITITEA